MLNVLYLTTDKLKKNKNKNNKKIQQFRPRPAEVYKCRNFKIESERRKRKIDQAEQKLEEEERKGS